ncbi:hypothetical protein CLV98_12341 [Dyadobacter jejuensis]|uniref:CobQ/CobB/MinD/ParA nucleotide binding domain-containing protein n=1 Tax=Dyadobacter jejuensis TaxID=1082580 RepID=A0A316ATE7_9BACT|nr:hypothetical protein [Dyadobacter jejuensis]PWJ53427.1 hypothetical protein CLV98_12341 [Dyadobacter jejuensis]
MKKQVTFICQSKGGTGKSFITWFIAKIKKDEPAAFIDLDKSTRTSSRLKKIVGEKRVLELSIMDENRKLDREMFLNLFEKIATTKTNEWYVDLGAPESDELKSFLANEVPANELREILEEIGIELKIIIVLAGGDALNASIQYYSDLAEMVESNLTIVALKNQGTFGSLQAQEAGEILLNNLGINRKIVGSMPVGNSAREITKLINGDITDEALSLAGKRTLRKLMEEIKENIQ